MAVNKVPPASASPAAHEAPKPLRFTATPLYAFVPDVSDIDVHDQLTMKLGQLEAMLLLAHYGDSSDVPLAAIPDNLQAHYLHGCLQMARECAALVERLNEMQSSSGVPK